MIKRILYIMIAAVMVSCSNEKTADSSTEANSEETKELTLYTHRHYDTDKEIFSSFEEKTGIKINVVKASADELIQKMETEGS